MCENEAADLYQLLRSRQVPILFQVYISSLGMPFEGSRRLYMVNYMVLSENQFQCLSMQYFTLLLCILLPTSRKQRHSKTLFRDFWSPAARCFGNLTKFAIHFCYIQNIHAKQNI